MLTQIICGDIGKNVTQMAHNVKKRLQIPFKCTCCQPKSQRNSMSKDTPVFRKDMQADLAQNTGINLEVKNNQVSKIALEGNVSRHRGKINNLH